MSTVKVDARDVHSEVSFTDAEARFMASLVLAAGPHLTPGQADLAASIAGKFLLANREGLSRLIDRYGEDAVLDYADSVNDDLDRLTTVTLP